MLTWMGWWEGVRPREEVVGAIHAQLTEVRGADVVARWHQAVANSGADVSRVSVVCQLAARMRAGEVAVEKYVINKSLTKNPEDYPDAKSQPHVQVATLPLPPPPPSPQPPSKPLPPMHSPPP